MLARLIPTKPLGLANPIGTIFILWFLSAIYFAFLLIISHKTRELFLTRLAGIKERDEREEMIVARSARSSFLFMVGFLLCLLFASTFRYGQPAQGPIEPKYQSLTVGHFGLFEKLHETESKDIDGKQTTIEYFDIPLSKTGLLLVLLLFQFISYWATARRMNRC